MARMVIIKLLYVECMEDDNTLNEENYVRHAWTEAELWCQRVVGLHCLGNRVTPCLKMHIFRDDHASIGSQKGG